MFVKGYIPDSRMLDQSKTKPKMTLISFVALFSGTIIYNIH